MNVDLTQVVNVIKFKMNWSK